jgi:hypothetical protein
MRSTRLKRSVARARRAGVRWAHLARNTQVSPAVKPKLVSGDVRPRMIAPSKRTLA